MATLSTVLTYARTQAQTDSNGLTDTNGIAFANEALQDFHRQLITNSIDASEVQEAYTDGTTGVGTYLYPTDMFFLKTIELNYTDTTANNYIQAQQIDVSNTPANQSFSWMRNNQSALNPMFDDRGDWFEIFPTPVGSNNTSQLIKIFYYITPTEYVATSDNIAYPESLDYRILAWRIASNYYYSIGKIEEGDKFNEKYEERVKQLISVLGRGSQQPIQAIPLSITGFEF